MAGASTRHYKHSRSNPGRPVSNFSNLPYGARERPCRSRGEGGCRGKGAPPGGGGGAEGEGPHGGQGEGAPPAPPRRRGPGGRMAIGRSGGAIARRPPAAGGREEEEEGGGRGPRARGCRDRRLPASAVRPAAGTGRRRRSNAPRMIPGIRGSRRCGNGLLIMRWCSGGGGGRLCAPARRDCGGSARIPRGRAAPAATRALNTQQGQKDFAGNSGAAAIPRVDSGCKSVT